MKYVPPANGDTGDNNRPYIDGNPGTGTEGSIVPAAALEHAQREIVNAITAAGLTPTDANLSQLAAAIGILASTPDATETVKGKVELATGAETITGTDTQRAITPAGFASAKSFATNGYYKLPGGLIFQWGKNNPSGGDATITFPIAFTTACYAMTVAADDTTAQGEGAAASNYTLTNFRLTVFNTNNGTPISGAGAGWMAVGR